MTLLNGAGKAVTANGWYVLNNAWNSGGLISGIDYLISSTFNAADIPAGVLLTWVYPAAIGPWPAIRAFPEIMFGPAPQGGGSDPGDIDHVFPIQVASLTGLTANYSVAYNGYTQGYNVAYDIWLTNTPNGDASHVTNEVMVWLHKGGFTPFGSVVGTYSDANFTGTIYHSDADNYTAIVGNKDYVNGTVDVAAILKKLQTLGIVSSSEYLADVELGAEVIGGAGSLTVNNLSLAVQSKGPGGATVSETVTGLGVTNATINGGSGDDVLLATAGNDIINGGAGTDRVSYVNAKSAVRVDLSIATAQATGGSGSDQLINIQNLSGSVYGDNLKAHDGVNSVLDGGAGNDTLTGGSGNDTLTGGAGNDFLYGGGGFNTASYANATAGVTIDLSLGGPQDTTGAGSDQLTSIQGVIGSAFNDRLKGKDGVNVTLDGGGGNDILTGGSGNDTLLGGTGNDTFYGGTGSNSIDGGAGNDTLMLSRSSANYTISRNANGSITVSGGGENDTVSNVEYLSFLNRTIATGAPVTRASDLNADGTSDILWQTADSRIQIWSMVGILQPYAGGAGSMGAGWHAIGTGDFDDNGTADILLQRDNGQVAVWMRDGNRVFYAGGVLNSAGATVAGPAALPVDWTSWQVLGAGDFDGDGDSDILWQGPGGQVQMWMMNGNTLVSSKAVSGSPGAGWSVAGIGDFNGDGASDLLWQDGTGQLQAWMMDGAARWGGGAVQSLGSSWHVKDTADFNGDGISDILLQSDSGQAGIELMKGTTALYAGGVVNGAGQAVASPGAGWNVVGAGDYNADGKADILWQDGSGNVMVWAMNGNTLLTAKSLGNQGTGWTLPTGLG